MFFQQTTIMFFVYQILMSVKLTQVVIKMPLVSTQLVRIPVNVMLASREMVKIVQVDLFIKL